MIDPFFEIIHDGEWNACVGVQGDELNYVEGYLEAARLLIDTLIDREMMGSRDTLAMPILYNARHGLELALKYASRRLERLGFVSRREGPTDHDILSYWRALHEAQVADLGVRAALSDLEPYVVSLARIDDDGQELRFHETIDGKPSLGENPVVNLPLIRLSVEEMAKTVGRLTNRIAVLEQEHHTGARTSRCSRTDLAEIARALGPHTGWSDPRFDEIRERLMQRFGLSKKAFSNAVNAIRDSRDLASRVEIETGLTHVSDEKVLILAERWLAAFPPPPDDFEPTLIRASDIDREKMNRDFEAVNTVVSHTREALSLEESADIETVFYIGRNRQYGEEYADDLERIIEQYRLEKDRPIKLRHVLSKLNFLEGLIEGLVRVGRPTLAVQLRDLRKAAVPLSATGATS